MRLLRNKLLRSIFGFALLAVLAIKFCSYSIACFSSSANAYSIEKSAEENKDKEEEAFEKAKKKMLLYEASLMVFEQTLSVNDQPERMVPYRLRIGLPPLKVVPTPPPDSISKV
ncbi:hypothetical protein AB669_17620 [Pedobacter sp. BMA]|nr:hypothetical protein AB669_17620 [Pedobacter sp. BMA]